MTGGHRRLNDIHNFREFGKYAAIGAAEGALTYLTGGGGAAGLNRVIAQGFTSGALGMIEKSTGIFSRNGGYFTYMIASAMIQGYLEHGIYSAEMPVELRDPSANRLKLLKDEYSAPKLGATQNYSPGKGRSVWEMANKYKSYNPVIKDVYLPGGTEPVGSVASDPIGGWGFFDKLASHTAGTNPTIFDPRDGTRYVIDRVCHQEVARAFWNQSLVVSPTQLFPKLNVYVTTGVYGPIGGTNALPVFIGVNYHDYLNNRGE